MRIVVYSEAGPRVPLNEYPYRPVTGAVMEIVKKTESLVMDKTTEEPTESFARVTRTVDRSEKKLTLQEGFVDLLKLNQND